MKEFWPWAARRPSVCQKWIASAAGYINLFRPSSRVLLQHLFHVGSNTQTFTSKSKNLTICNLSTTFYIVFKCFPGGGAPLHFLQDSGHPLQLRPDAAPEVALQQGQADAPLGGTQRLHRPGVPLALPLLCPRRGTPQQPIQLPYLLQSRLSRLRRGEKRRISNLSETAPPPPPPFTSPPSARQEGYGVGVVGGGVVRDKDCIM